MKLVFIGLTLSSSWGNGHATTYRTLLRALAQRGHHCIFFECSRPWYLNTRDLIETDFCDLRFYDGLGELQSYRQEIRSADAVIVGSFTCEGRGVNDFILREAGGICAFYDIDTPVTVAMLSQDQCAYVSRHQLPLFDLYLSFSGGPKLEKLTQHFGVKRPRPLYCSSELPMQAAADALYDLTYMGTYSDDRQPMLEEFLLSVARAAPQKRFLVAGPQYPDHINWPSNVERREHLSPEHHAEFYGLSRFTLNVTRSDMKRFGFSPSVRLFEAAAAGAPIISDWWPGIETVFQPSIEIALANSGDAVMRYLSLSEAERKRMAKAARERFDQDHSPARRAKELELYLAQVSGAVQPEGASCCCP